MSDKIIVLDFGSQYNQREFDTSKLITITITA